MPSKSKSKSRTRPKNGPLMISQINALVANLRKIFGVKGKK
jgi:hypothetical protein